MSYRSLPNLVTCDAGNETGTTTSSYVMHGVLLHRLAPRALNGFLSFICSLLLVYIPSAWSGQGSVPRRELCRRRHLPQALRSI